MYISYNPDHNIGYIRFKDTQGKVANTISLSGDLNVDMADDGSIYGIELLNANEQLKGTGTAIIVENQQSHILRELQI